MKAFVELFVLEVRAIVRSRALAFLAVASVAWMFALPLFVRGDGTSAGLREVYLRYSLGGVFVLLLVSLVAAATGAIAHDREAKRLQLTMIRPVRLFSIAFARYAALATIGAAVMALAAALAPLGLRTALAPFGEEASDAFPRCNHVLKPVLPSTRDEARAMYAAFMADTNTPAEVRHARKSVVLRLLENRAMDNYQTIATNATVGWRFPSSARDGEHAFVRLRFTNSFEMRQDVRGVFRFGNACAVVSNITQAVVVVPLVGPRDSAESKLTFENNGRGTLMLRPRRDLDVLVTADDFAFNLVRAWAELVGILALVIAAGVFLGAGLGRPVALFVAMVMLAVSEMSPSVIEQYPDELETKRSDRIGLAITRAAAGLTHPVSSLTPLDKLSKDECVEVGETIRSLAVNVILVPALLSLLAAFVMPRKEEM